MTQLGTAEHHGAARWIKRWQEDDDEGLQRRGAGLASHFADNSLRKLVSKSGIC